MDCLTKLRAYAPDCRCFATFFPALGDFDNPAESHDHGTFRYRREDLELFAAASGWDLRYIGDWNHPRGQVMAEFH
ncbi:MAG TPA: hypothetical protein VE990_07700 [Acidimicrobiales bacterium]|nr:hypothetical protein [Acidimicrobiales bacterium]